MNGQLSEHPLVELIREISRESLGGRLHLEHDRVKVVAYFDEGDFLYAASNVRTLRLREYLKKSELVSDSDLAQFNERVSDTDLVKVLCAQKLLSPTAAEEVQTKLIVDILRLALLWTDGTWEFDPRSRLKEKLNLKIDVASLLLEAARRLPPKREGAASALSGQQSVPQKTPPASVREEPPPVSRETDPQDVENFLLRVKNAKTHYEVLDVGHETSTQDLKTVYYQLARRYHPDRFRKAEAALMNRIQSAFARITQAYETLRDDTARANYNAKIAARKKAEQLADSAAKRAAPIQKAETVGQPDETSDAERAETQFKEGFAALELGQRRVALSLFASAARAAPNEPRYRAFYGQMLAANEATRRTAEAELNAAIKLDPGNAEYRVMLAELYRDLGLKLRAKGEAERAVAADPNNQKARDLLRGLK